MANRYWVGGTANWDATAGTKWATTSGGAGGAAVPTAADDVFFDAASGAVTATITGADAKCRSLNCTGFTGTLAHVTGWVLLIGDATAGAGNIALKFVSGMTYSPTGTAQIRFVSTNATVQDIDYGGKTVGPIQINGLGGSWRYVSDQVSNSNGSLTLTAGTLDTNSQTISTLTMSVTGGTFTPGSSSITVTGTANGSLTFGSGATYTANTATYTLSGNGGGMTNNANINGGSVVLSHSTSNTVSGTGTVANLTRTGGAVKTASLTIFGNITVTGTFAVNGNSVINRVLVASSTLGTARTITAATVSCSNVDLRDITGAGAGSWNLSAITGNSGDCGGNTNITFTSGTTQTATGTASFTWSTHGWTSRVPLPQDTAVISNAFVSSRIVTFDMPRVGTVDFTGSTGNVSLVSTSTQVEFYGHLTLRSGMGNCAFNSLAHASFIGAAQQNLTMAGNANSSPYNIYIDRSKLQLQDDYLAPTNVFTNSIVTRNSGFIDTQGFDVRCAYFWAQNTANVNLLSTSTFTLMYTTTASIGTILEFSAAARVSAANADFVIAVAALGPRIFSLTNAVVNSLTYTVASSPGLLQVAGGGTIGTLNLGSARTFQQTAGTTLTIGTTINATGSVITNGLTSVSASGSVTSPASAALTPSTEVEIVCRASNLDWTPTTPRYLISRQGNSAAFNNFAFGVSNSTSGMLFFTHSNGTTQNTYNSTAVPSLTDGSTYWLKMTWRNSDGRIQFFYAADQTTEPSSWTQIGTNVTGTTSAMNPTPTNGLEIGGNVALPRFWNGNIYRTIVRKTIGGAADFDADFTAKAWGADTLTESANAAVVTLTAGEAQASDGAIRFRSTTPGSTATISKASGEISVNYASIKDSVASGGATVYAVDSYNEGNNTGWNFINSWIPRIISFFTG